MRWGTSWGLAAGFWLLAPLVLRTHHIVLTTAKQWTAMTLVFSVLFAAFGAALGVLVAAIAAAVRSRMTGAAWFIPALTGLAAVPAYFALGAVIYAFRFGRVDNGGAYLGAMATAMTPVACAAVLVVMVGCLGASRGVTRVWRRMAVVLFVAACAGAGILPWRAPEAGPVEMTAYPLTRLSGPPRVKHPLLVVGLDGGNWRTLQPVVDAGRAPTFRDLETRGSRGDMDAIWPPFWSTSAWGAIFTGFSRDEVGVFEDLVETAPGLPPFQAPLDLDPRLIPVSAVEYVLVHTGIVRAVPPPRSALQRPPVWEWLDRSGIRTGVVRLNFTYPADGQATAVIANRVVPDMWDMLGVMPADAAGLAAPASRRAALLAPFSPPWTPDPADLARILPQSHWPTPAGMEVDPKALIARVLAFDERTFVAATQMIADDPSLDVVMIHLGGFDNICHALWPYRFPEDFRDRPSAADVGVLGPVVDRYLEFIDQRLAALVAAFPSNPNIVVVSDHGEGPREHGAPWRGIHATPGMFLAAGPDVPAGHTIAHVSYDDITPTLLDLESLAPPPGMHGRSLVRGRDLP